MKVKLIKSFLLALALLCPGIVLADAWTNAQSKNAGNYAQTFSITVTTNTATLIVDPTYAIQAAAVDIFPNNAYTLWIGTNTTTLPTTGFPVLSSKTYTTDGQFTGSLYATAEAAAGGNVNVRVIYWMKSDWKR